MKLRVAKIERFSAHDGPGVRTVVFLKGCPLRCAWCHNPETQRKEIEYFYHAAHCIGCGSCIDACGSMAHTLGTDGTHTLDRNKCISCMSCADICPSSAIERVGNDMTVEEIIDTVLKDRAFYGDSGGLTVSGGEPMFDPEGCLALLSAARSEGISTAVETCGYFDEKYAVPLAELTDHLLWDLKDGVSERHKIYTGVGNELIINNLIKADAVAKHITVRCICVNGVNTDHASVSAIAETADKLCHCDGIELIPYHAYGGSKATQIGHGSVGNTDWIPSHETLKEIREMFGSLGHTVS